MKNIEIYHLVSNTHWDREWYQSHEKYLVRLVELCDRLISLMENEKEYRFVLDGQYAMIGDYLECKPEMTDRVCTLVREGRLLAGPWYTQPLEGLVKGEALVRNLQYGISASEKLGNAMRVSYEVDEFGHTSQLPQILKGFGIDSVIAWRGVPKQSKNRFIWQAPDGTEVDMFRSNGGYGEATALPEQVEDYEQTIDGTSYFRDGLISRISKIRTLRLAVSATENMLWLNGIDHSWAQENLMQVLKKIRKLFPEIDVRVSTPKEYIEAVRKEMMEKSIQPEIYTGELMVNHESVLESVNSLHPKQKKRHYESEDLLTRITESMTCLSWLYGRKYPKWALDRAWGFVLENHAHDSLGCTSVDEVYEQVMARYDSAISLAEQISDDSIRSIMSHGAQEPSLWLINCSNAPSGGVTHCTVDIPFGYGKTPFVFTDTLGNVLNYETLSSAQIGDVRYNPDRGHPTYGKRTRMEMLINLPTIPAGGWKRWRISSGKALETERITRKSYFVKEPCSMENEFLKINFYENGTFDMLDKVSRHVYPSQLLLEDTGDAGHCYTHEEPLYDHKQCTSKGVKADISCLYDTALGAAFSVQVEMNIPAGLSEDRKKRLACTVKERIRFTVSLNKGDRYVGIRAEVENKARDHRLRILFPSMLEDAVNSESGQAFDIVQRPIHIEDDDNCFCNNYPTHPMQDFCAVSQENKGLAVAAKGMYEYECLDDDSHALAITLLRCNDTIDLDSYLITPEYRMEAAEVLGNVSFEMALIPYDGMRTATAVLREVKHALFSPILCVNRQTEESVLPGYVHSEVILPDEGTAFSIKGEGVQITTFKRAFKRESLIVRLCNYSDKEVDGSFAVTLPGIIWQSAYETNLEEERLHPINVDVASFHIRAKGIITLEFVPEQ